MRPGMAAAMIVATIWMRWYWRYSSQQIFLCNIGRAIWQKTHKGIEYSWPHLPYLDKAWPCYHAPEPLRLDVLMKIIHAQADAILQKCWTVFVPAYPRTTSQSV